MRKRARNSLKRHWPFSKTPTLFVKSGAPRLSLLLIFFWIAIAGCNPTRRLALGEQLYRGASIAFEASPEQDERQIRDRLEELIQPTPNNRPLGIPFRLGIYQTFDRDNDGKGVGHWIKTRLGEPPVLYTPRPVRRTRLRMERALRDRGFLQAGVTADTTVRRRQVRVQYLVTPGPRYTVNRYLPVPDTLPLAEPLNRFSRLPPLRPGAPVLLGQLEAERRRLTRLLRQEGYYGVGEQDFIFYLDTLPGRQADIYLRTIPRRDSSHYQLHRIGNTTVRSSPPGESTQAQDTLQQSGLQFVGYENFLRPAVVRRLIRQEKGDVYRPSLEQRTLSHLNGLGVFQFVNLSYRRRSSEKGQWLDRQFFLLPDQPQTFSAEVEATTKAGLVGSNLNLAYTHRNLFRGAERLRLSLSGGLLTELGQGSQWLNAFEINGEARLEVPRFLSPLFGFSPASIQPPRTIFSVGGQYLFRVDNFTLNALRMRAGYRWQPSTLHRHELYPVTFSQQNLLRSSEAFEERLRLDPRLRAGVEDIFIMGASYRYLYSEPESRKRNSRYYALASAETSGNVAALFGSRQVLLGRPYSRYLRLEIDGRHYARFGEALLVSRLNLGAGWTFGESRAMPFSRQFFAGGANSVRAFRIRRLGPGRDTLAQDETTVFSDQTGDIKLEANLEYRFPLISYLRGALFVDAGNIWLMNMPEDGNRRGLFEWDDFWKELGVGAGLGLRLDIDFVVLRLDAAFALRKPSRLPDNAWIRDFRPFQSEWRRDNLVWHLSLGYPF